MNPVNVVHYSFDQPPTVAIPETGSITSFKRIVLAHPFKFTPAHWQQVLGFIVLDPDGWRCSHERHGPKDWDEPVTLHEFRWRASFSTTTLRGAGRARA